MQEISTAELILMMKRIINTYNGIISQLQNETATPINKINWTAFLRQRNVLNQQLIKGNLLIQMNGTSLHLFRLQGNEQHLGAIVDNTQFVQFIIIKNAGI